MAVAVLGRSAGRAEEIAYIASTRAHLSGSHVSFTAHALDAWQDSAAAGAMARLRPRVAVNCASLQSPWEGSAEPSAWTRLLADGGFGLGLPLHAALATRLAAAIASSGVPALFVNASYPDAVNPLLRALGLPVFCGIGNVATLAAGLHAALGVPDGALQVLAHHVHLHPPAEPQDELRAWHENRPMSGIGDLLARQRAASRQALNAVTGHAAAILLARVVAGEELRANLPGPLGLPGGYPVVISRSRIALDLPADINAADAVAWQMRMAEREGVTVDEKGTVTFGVRARAALTRYLPGLPEQFAARDLAGLAGQMLRLREKLRGVPAPETASDGT
jgi:hypothetical protein